MLMMKICGYLIVLMLTRNSSGLCLEALIIRKKTCVKNIKIRLQKWNDSNMQFLYRRMKGKVFDHETRQFRHI